MRVEIKGFKEASRKLNNIAQDAIDAALRVAGPRVVEKLKRQTAAEDAVVFGNFQRGWTFEISRPNGATASRDLVIKNTAPYAAVTEYGLEPGTFPWPLDKLAAWADKRGIIELGAGPKHGGKIEHDAPEDASELGRVRIGRIRKGARGARAPRARLKETRPFTDRERSPQQVVWAIAKSIEQRGLGGKDIIRKSSRYIRKIVQTEIERALQRNAKKKA